jgi:hypothetical protein
MGLYEIILHLLGSSVLTNILLFSAVVVLVQMRDIVNVK